MYGSVITKRGERAWYPIDQPVLSRREIARIEFAKWELKQEIRKTKAS